MEQEALRIGDVASRVGLSVRALRYYEEQGLLHPDRTPSGQRAYAVDAVDRVRLLRHLYAAGLSSANIAELLPCIDAPSAHTTAESIAALQRTDERLTEQIDHLAAARGQLRQLLMDVRSSSCDDEPALIASS